jgi:integrase
MPRAGAPARPARHAPILIPWPPCTTCGEAHTDLDGEARTLALLAQAWAAGGDPAPTTYNQRLAIVSSFYRYAHKHGLLEGENPIGRVERRPVQAYSGVQPLDPTDVGTRLKAIDRTTVVGARDYALLAVALRTGRRVSELASLRWQDLATRGDRVILTWRRTKGGKTMNGSLDPRASAALLAWLRRYYGADLGSLTPDAPIRPSLAHNGTGGQALRPKALARMCEQRMGTSQFHALRHTVAVGMEQKGAKLSDIQEQLGHANAATTGIYMRALHRAENPQAAGLADLFWPQS